MGLETGWNCHISLTPNGDVPGSEIPPSSPSHAGSLHDDLHQGERTAPKPLWMPRVSRMVLLNPFIGSCVLTRYLILQSFEHKAGWAWGVCMREWESLTFTAFLPSQYCSCWKQTSFCAQLPWFYNCSLSLLVLAEALVKPLRVSLLPVHCSSL